MLIPDHDPRVPGRTILHEAFLAFVFGTLAISIMGLIAHFASAPFIFPSLGPTAFLIFHRPTASAASPRNTITGHAIGAACGLGALALCGLLDAGSVLTQGEVTVPRALAAGLSLGATSGLMVLFKRGHPPAGATTLIISLGLMSQPDEVAVLLLAVVLLVGEGLLIHRIAGTPYPLWRPGHAPVG